MINLALVLALLGQSNPVPSALSDGLSADAIQAAYDSYAPAVCLVSYSVEITNPNTGEVSRRGNRTVGLIVSPDGLVMTHGHMIITDRRPFNVQVTVGEGEDQVEYDAVPLAKPEDVNIAFLQIEPDEPVRFPYVSFEQARLDLGDPVFMIGIMGASFDFARSIQSLRVGAVLEQPRRTYALEQAIPFNYVGGPVFDRRGRAIGVVGFDLSSQEGGELYTRDGHPLIYQAELFQRYIAKPPGEETLETSEDAWLGVFTQPLTDDLAEYWGLAKDGGIVVSTIIPGSPAAESGILPGDVLLEFNGQRIRAKQDQDVLGFTKMVRESPIGEALPLLVVRDGERKAMELTLSTRPRTARDAREFEDDTLGLSIREITTDVRIALNIASDVDGVIITRIRQGSPANQAGLRPRFIVLRINDTEIATVEEYEAAIDALKASKPSEVTLFCRVGAATAFFRLQPRWSE